MQMPQTPEWKEMLVIIKLIHNITFRTNAEPRSEIQTKAVNQEFKMIIGNPAPEP